MSWRRLLLLQSPSARDEQSVDAAMAAGGPSLRIVVADNDPSVLKLLSTDLALEGHVVVALASSGEEALVACQQHRPDVLIVDYRMPPGWDGLETIRRVRAEGASPTCILYSNYRSPGIAAMTARLGGIYVKKGPLRMLREALRIEPASQSG